MLYIVNIDIISIVSVVLNSNRNDLFTFLVYTAVFVYNYVCVTNVYVFI